MQAGPGQAAAETDTPKDKSQGWVMAPAGVHEDQICGEQLGWATAS